MKDLLNDNFIGSNGKYSLAELTCSWKINYLSWKKKKKFEGIVIKYEDLINDTENEFKRILIFLKKSFKTIENPEEYFFDDEKKILKSIKSCQFSELRKMEDTMAVLYADDTNILGYGREALKRMVEII